MQLAAASAQSPLSQDVEVREAALQSLLMLSLARASHAVAEACLCVSVGEAKEPP